MLTILANGVNDALRQFTRYYADDRLVEVKESRNGPVKAFNTPVTTGYNSGRFRVLHSPARDANPFFHLFEALWMLGGRNDVEFLQKFNSTIGQFSDDGFTLHGAYGHRWREHFKVDQLARIINELRRSMNTRRAVLSMWDPYIDPDVAEVGGKDVPCNTHIYFSFKDGALDMTVLCRSNDAIWGCYGANAVHMSILHEYVAIGAVMPIGRYYQVSNDLHVYEKHWHLMNTLGAQPPEDPYRTGRYQASPFLYESGQRDDFDRDVNRFLEAPFRGIYRTDFMAKVVAPMAQAFEQYKGGNPRRAIEMLDHSEYDWHIAGQEWIERRAK